MTGSLSAILDVLEQVDGAAPEPPTRDGWELVLLENVGYLVADSKRLSAFERLRDEVGLSPEAVLAADPRLLESICVGMRPKEWAMRLHRCAELRLAGARWRDYPGIGRPGVERIEMFEGSRPVLALESNGLRVLYRLGYGEPGMSYDRTYRDIQRAVMPMMPAESEQLIRTHQLLRRHGQTRCRRTNPDCANCPVANRCATGQGQRPLTDD